MDRERKEEARHTAYLEKQERVFLKKQEKWMKCAVVGRICTLEKCGKNFTDLALFEAHLAEHKADMKRRRVCTQDKCGKTLPDDKAWREHVEEHKNKLVANIINSIRSVLLLNKHGLLLDAFEREYKGVAGRPVPYKMMGASSLYDLLVSLTDVVQMVKLGGGHILLVGKPNSNTAHMARMVSSQRENSEGYNYKTGQVVRGLDRETVQGLSCKPPREVPAYLINQLKELMLLRGGRIPLAILPNLYSQEFSYCLQWKEFNFTSLEDLLSSPQLASTLQLYMEDEEWSIGPVRECETYSMFQQRVLVPQYLQDSLVRVLAARPAGLAVSSLPMVCEDWASLHPGDLGCEELTEVCLAIPWICTVREQETKEDGFMDWIISSNNQKYSF